MSSTCRQRYFGEEKESCIKYPYKGQARFLQICLNYQGSSSPLTCTVDGHNLKEIATKYGVKDLVCLYDDGSTELHPTKQNVTQQFIQMAERCQIGDIMIVLYSGHGTHTEDLDGDESDGEDEAFCLTNQNGETQLLIDDDIALLVSTYMKPKIPLLFLVDACHSGTIIDLKTAGLWGGKQVFSISGCQDHQTSGDTGNGGIMTHALLHVLNSEVCKQRRKKRDSSIQFIFNRMVERLKLNEGEANEELIEEGEDEEEVELEYQFEQNQNWDLQEGEFEVEEGDDEFQIINLSWCGGTDPTIIPFPF